MRAFYDQKIPNIVRKYIKKWGGEVGETNINANRVKRIKKEPEGYYTAWLDKEQVGGAFGDRQSAQAALKEAGGEPSTVPSFDVTPAMRESVMQGQPLFRTNADWSASVDHLDYTRGEDWIDFKIYDKSGEVIREYTIDFDQAKTVLGDSVTQRILDGGKAGVLKGAELEGLNPGGGVVRGAGGATWWDEYGRAVMHAFKRADVADFLHEYIHAITPLLGDADRAIIERWYEAEYGRKPKAGWYEKGAPDPDVFEKVARGFEKYMTEGPTGFTGEIVAVFNKIKKWMLDVYKSITHPEIDVNLNDEMRGMFDRWLGKEKEAVTTEPPTSAPSMWDKQHGRAEQGNVLKRNLPADEDPMPSPIGTADELMGLPLDETMFEGWIKEVAPILDRATYKMIDKPRTSVKLEEALGKEDMSKLRQHLGKVYTQMADNKMAAVRYAETRRNAALLDYTRRTGWDETVGAILPYQFWFTRSALQWALRVLNKPSILANLYRYKRMSERHTEGDGFPERLRGKMAIPMPFLPDWMGDTIYVDPLRQIYPFLNMARPFEQMGQEKNQLVRSTETILQDMVENGEITQDQADEALDTQQGALWNKAYSIAKSSADSRFQDPFDYMFALASPNLPVGIAHKILTGRTDEIGQLPSSRLIQTATAAAGIGGPRGWNPEGWIRKATGLPEVDKWEDYRVDRELASMTAEGLINAEEAQLAMLNRSGEVFDQAQRRVSQQGAVKYIGAVLAADVFPEGEAESRALKNEYSKALTAYKNGDDEAITKFWDKHPEYEGRRALFRDGEERLRKFLISQIWETINTMKRAERKVAMDAMGNDFEELFYKKNADGMHSYDLIKTDTLALWANTLKADVPNSVAGEGIPYEQPPQEVINATEKYYSEKDRLFPDIDQINEAYYAMPEEYRADNEQVDEYNRWRNKYFAEHPEVIPYLIGEDNKLYGLPQDIQAYVYQYRALRDEMFPNIFKLQNQYFAIKDRNQRAVFRNSHPDLVNYWDFRREYAAQYPEASPYILSDESLLAAILGESGGGGSYSTSWGGGGGGGQSSKLYLTRREADMFSPPLIRQLIAYFYRGEPLMQGGRAELERIWEATGKKAGSVDNFLDLLVRPLIMSKY